ncbi:putative ferric-chelate reductase (NADH) [Helianthus anomalus]
MLGHIVMTLFTSHGVCYIIYWIVTKQISEVVNGLVVCNRVINMMYACDYVNSTIMFLNELIYRRFMNEVVIVLMVWI